MTKFEVGKSYSVYPCGTYKVTKRTGAFVTFVSAGGTQTIRRKPIVAVDGTEWVEIPYNHTINARNVK